MGEMEGWKRGTGSARILLANNGSVILLDARLGPAGSARLARSQALRFRPATAVPAPAPKLTHSRSGLTLVFLWL